MAKVLLVEDDVQIVTLYSIKLNQEGYDLVCAENGLAGLKALDSFTPDIILLDLRMPVMSGEKFLEKIRNQTKFADIPVIVLTNISRSEAPKTIWHYGISDYVVKAHSTPRELVELINRTLAS